MTQASPNGHRKFAYQVILVLRQIDVEITSCVYANTIVLLILEECLSRCAAREI